MVRGNWQKRVETAEARRKDAKQRKQRSEDRRQYKIWAQECFALMDRHRDKLKKYKLHIWTDTLPADDEQHELMASSGNKGRKKRSNSLGNELGSSGKTGGKGRNRSTSNADKKVHPRSKEASIHDERVVDEPRRLWMCRSYFFTGKCDEMASRGSGRKSGGCRYVHNSNSNSAKLDKTLCHVLTSSKTAQSKSTRKEGLKTAEEAAAVATSAEDGPDHPPPGAMRMIFYLELPLMKFDGADDLDEDDGEDHYLGSQIADWLAGKHLKLANIVYIALGCDDNDGGVLVFDQHKDGGLIHETDRDFLVAVLGPEAAGRCRRDSIGSQGDEDGSTTSVRNFPGTILEHILTFLPDAAVPAASRVCKAWHYEFGKNSPNLWKHMLERRSWPHTCGVDSSGMGATAQHEEYKVQFLEHYSVLRDMKAIQSGLSAITDHSRRDPRATEREMAFIDFSRRKNAPSQPNSCVELCEWSPNRVLVAYHDDCSLRLFETVPKSGDSGERRCREIICQKINPYAQTKKRSCKLVSMGLDEECIGSLCHVMSDNFGIDAEAYILVLISRDEFLLGDSSDAVDTDMPNLKVIDVGQAVLNYLLSSDVGDHRLLRLIDFLSDGREIGEVEVLVSQTIAACGYGRFMVEASISIPVDEADGSSMMSLVDRKLFLFSAGIGAIVWMGESNYLDSLSHELLPRRDEIVLSYILRPYHDGGSRTACAIAVGSATSPAIQICEIKPSGQIQSMELVQASLLARNEIALQDDWEISSSLRPIRMTPSDVVAADLLVKRVDEAVCDRKVIVSFYPRYHSVDEPSYSLLEVHGNLEVVEMACVRSSYIVLLCTRHPKVVLTQAEGEAGAREGIDGHWFADQNDPLEVEDEQEAAVATEDSHRRDVVAVILHIPSRQEIARLCLLEGHSPDTQLPSFLNDCNETMGVGLTHKGVVLTGADVRACNIAVGACALDELSSKASKKKKKRQSNRGKKDGFARGMSLRG